MNSETRTWLNRGTGAGIVVGTLFGALLGVSGASAWFIFREPQKVADTKPPQPEQPADIAPPQTMTRKSLDKEMLRLERLRESVQTEIDVTEKAIKFLSRPLGTVGEVSKSTTLRALHAEAERLHTEAKQAVEKMELEKEELSGAVVKLKAQQPEMVDTIAEKQRQIKELQLLIAIKQEVRDSLKKDADSLRKVLDAPHPEPDNIEAVRTALQTKRNLLAEIDKNIIEVRLKYTRLAE